MRKVEVNHKHRGVQRGGLGGVFGGTAVQSAEEALQK